jgi:hypothetical protein
MRRYKALKRLDDQARRLERTVQGPSLASSIGTERAASPALDGRSVFGWSVLASAADRQQNKSAGSWSSSIDNNPPTCELLRVKHPLRKRRAVSVSTAGARSGPCGHCT